MKEAMLYSAMTPALGAQLTQLLMQAGRIVVGAGWGLSSAAGLPREEDEMSAEFAPLVQAGLVTYAQAEAALTPEDARFWGYWFRRIRKLRFQSGRSAVHDHLCFIKVMWKTDAYILCRVICPGCIVLRAARMKRMQCLPICAGRCRILMRPRSSCRMPNGRAVRTAGRCWCPI